MGATQRLNRAEKSSCFSLFRVDPKAVSMCAKNPDPSRMTQTPAIQAQTFPLQGPRIRCFDTF